MNHRCLSGRAKTGAVGLVLGALLLTGCTSHYTMTLNNGGSVITRGKPRLEHGYYVFKDATGKDQRINSLRVREISAH